MIIISGIKGQLKKQSYSVHKMQHLQIKTHMTHNTLLQLQQLSYNLKRDICYEDYVRIKKPRGKTYCGYPEIQTQGERNK